jgi:hypothetical protein
VLVVGAIRSAILSEQLETEPWTMIELLYFLTATK